MADLTQDYSELSKEDLIALLQDAHGDIYVHQVILGESAVPREWHSKANEMLNKYRPLTDRIQALADGLERRE